MMTVLGPPANLGSGRALPLRSHSGAGLVIGLLYVSYLLSFADRVIFGMSLKAIKATLNLSDSQLGLLSGAAFAVSYAVFSPIGGVMVDRFRRKAVWALAIVFFSATTMFTGFAGSFVAMAAARVGVGVGESFISPLAVSLISDVVPRVSRARTFGVYLSAGALGSIAALLIGGLVVRSLSGSAGVILPIVGLVQPWQGLFVAAALPGFVLAFVILVVLREPTRTVAGPLDADVHGFENIVPFIRNYWPLITAMFVGLATFQLSAYTYGAWAVVFFERVHGWSPVRSALTLGSTTAVSTLIGCLMCGRIIDALRRRGYVDAPLRVGMFAGTFFAVFGIAGMLAPDPNVALACLTIGTFTSYMPAVSIYATMGDVVPAAARGRFAATHTLAIGIIANALGPLMVGLFSDHLFPQANGIRYSLALTFATATVIGAVVVTPALAYYRRRMAELTT